MNTWIAGKDLMKSYYLTKKLFTVVKIWKILQILIIDMKRMYSKTLINKNLCDYYDLYVLSDT